MKKLMMLFSSSILLFIACKKEPAIYKSAVIPQVSKSSPTVLSGPDLSNYIFVGQDDFNGTALNTIYWTYYDSTIVRGSGFRELPSNIVVSGGTVKIYSRRTHDTSYSGGFITTQPSINQRYGYFEISAKMTTLVAPVCAFWLLSDATGTEVPVPNPSLYGTEVDIFEYTRTGPANDLHLSLHWNGYNNADGSAQVVTTTVNRPGLSTGFHTFGLEWTPKEYIFYEDGAEIARTSIAISHIPEYVILSTEFGGFGGDKTQMSTTTPDIFEVDYLKVYARKPSVTLYGDNDYYGWISAPLLPGTYTTAQLAALGVFDNQTSSIEVPPGWKATAFDGDNLTGDSVQVTTDARSAATFNDRLSSLRVTAP